jgi:hypothetical protein
MVRSLVTLAVGCTAAAVAAGASARSEVAYSYGGVQSGTLVAGIAGTVVPVARPVVRTGHVAAWIGVGGIGVGPAASDQWLQIGVNAVAGGGTAIYEEWKSGRAYRYTEVLSGIRVGEAHRVELVAAGSGRWQARLDGRPVGPAYPLAGAQLWHGQATAETFAPDAGRCNRFAYRIADVVELRGGHPWRRLAAPLVFRDARLSLTARSGGYDLTGRC